MTQKATNERNSNSLKMKYTFLSNLQYRLNQIN